MMSVAVTVFIFCATYSLSVNGGLAVEDEKYLRFPPDFLLGAATSAYQVEGAWNASGKGESVWDRFVHEDGTRVVNNETGDIASDSYHKFKEDVALLKEIGFNSYRFSVSWPRILPKGFANEVSEDGVRYYHELIDELKANNIVPVLTLYHWDHPQVIEDAGGWTNAKIVDWFGDYARVVYKEYGSKVKLFVTVNEPCYYCLNVYAYGIHAPGKISLRGIGEYLCVENLLKAHARAYRIYEEEFKPTQNGSVGINVHVQGHYPKYPNDSLSSELAFQFTTGWILHPIYSNEGDYPEIMKTVIAKRSQEQGYRQSRLPELSTEWKEYIRGTSDFLTINHYTSRLVEPGIVGDEPSFMNDLGLIRSIDPSWKSSNSSWLMVVPEGFGDVLRKLSTTYDNPAIYVMENGVSDAHAINDVDRIEYYREYVKHMLVAINRDGVNVKGYILWSLLDNFEWESGFSQKFGIVHVNFTDPQRKRALKESAHWWKRVIHDGKL